MPLVDIHVSSLLQIWSGCWFFYGAPTFSFGRVDSQINCNRSCRVGTPVIAVLFFGEAIRESDALVIIGVKSDSICRQRHASDASFFHRILVLLGVATTGSSSSSSSFKRANGLLRFHRIKADPFSSSSACGRCFFQSFRLQVKSASSGLPAPYSLRSVMGTSSSCR